MTEWRGIATGAAAAIIAGVVLQGTGVLGAVVGEWGEQASNAASRERVRALESKVESLPGSQQMRDLSQQLEAFTQTLYDLRSDIRSVQRDAESNAGDINRLTSRQGYVWDSVTQICTRLEIACATRNAIWEPPEPLPRPRAMRVEHVALHKTGASHARAISFSEPD